MWDWDRVYALIFFFSVLQKNTKLCSFINMYPYTTYCVDNSVGTNEHTHSHVKQTQKSWALQLSLGIVMFATPYSEVFKEENVYCKVYIEHSTDRKGHWNIKNQFLLFIYLAHGRRLWGAQICKVIIVAVCPLGFYIACVQVETLSW